MADTFTQYFEGLKDKKILVLGLGVSNRPLVRLLLQAGCQVTGCDRTPREKLEPEVLELEKLGCTLHLGESYLRGFPPMWCSAPRVCTREILPWKP